ncbi:hypothetical protein VKT23_008344 [Stygiomarasmius scandens]|uniref:Uncharacterized protein n=1 Tax=Marasmiellus scandens TaxID=2682957 RepID=A0ABR1JHY6_9AGAR
MYSVLAIFSLFAVARALVLTTPSPSFLVTNGSATVTWNAESGDPQGITIRIRNNATLNSFDFAADISVGDGNVTGILQNIPASGDYFVQAVDATNTSNVLANSKTFAINSTVASTTTSATTFTSSSVAWVPASFSSISSAFFSSLDTFPSSTAAFPAAQVRSSTPVGSIVGGVIGGIVMTVLAFLVSRTVRKRNIRRSTRRFLIDPVAANGSSSSELPSFRASTPLIYSRNSPSTSDGFSQLDESLTAPEPYPLTIPSPYPHPTHMSSKRRISMQEQTETERKLDQVNSQKARMMEQWEKTVRTESETTTTTLTSVNPFESAEDSVVGSTSTRRSSTGITSLGSESARPLDPEIQRQLDEMSKRIRELEVEKAQLTRELRSSVPPPGYAE